MASVSTECHHSKEPFNCAFECIERRRDISCTAKRVYARLVSQHRLLRRGRDAAWTQRDIADALGLTRTQVWDAIEELKAADLVSTIRHGQGRPNEYVLYGVEPEDLDGKGALQSSGRSDRHQDAGGYRHPSGASFKGEKKDREEVISTRKCYGCGGPHRSAACPRYPGAIKG